MKFAIAFAIKSSPKVCYKNLRPLENADRLALKSSLVAEARKVLSQEINQLGRRVVGFRDEIDDTAVEILAKWMSAFSSRPKQQTHLTPNLASFSQADHAFME